MRVCVTYLIQYHKRFTLTSMGVNHGETSPQNL